MLLSELRANVRRQTETLSEELPDSTIDWYLKQAYDRQIGYENDWPFFEKTWDLMLLAGATEITLPGDLNTPGIESLQDRVSGYRLTMIDSNQADDWFGGVSRMSVEPLLFSIWAGKIKLWPDVDFTEDRPYQLRGHRTPVDWVALGPSGSPDCDARLHPPMIHYAIALAYAQQEDETLENVYMQRWQMDFGQARTAIMEPVYNKPLIMGPRFITPVGYDSGRYRATVNPPPGGP